MNKTEKLICMVLGAVLAWYVFFGSRKDESAAATATRPAVTNAVQTAVRSAAAAPIAKPAEVPETPILPAVPENIVVLENDEVRLELSSWGAVVKKAVLKGYAVERGGVSESNPPMELDFSAAPLGELSGVEQLAPNAVYEVREVTSNSVVFANAAVERKVTLERGYRISYAEKFAKAVTTPTTLSLGAMTMGGSKNDLLSVDSLALTAKGEEVIHHGDDDSPLKGFLAGSSGGCSSSRNAAGEPPVQTVDLPGAQRWVALKNRFFVTALCSSSAANTGFSATIRRDLAAADYRPQTIAARMTFPTLGGERTSVFYVGPKKQSLLWDLGMKDVMEFGMWRWLCYPLVWVLNLFNSWVPNFGVAIILLTVLVRLVFWPLTRKSTEGMKKMQEIQPLMKELQAKFKDNPQRLQQETWALYREKKVNPLSSCLPMLIQIPVFIALFNVLRSAVELRYASFLWIGDLSEPEGLFASWFPFGGLNILPILMAVSTALQSYFTPSGGDKNQQKMMMIMMPAMMLFMFYSFPSALSLYWFLSNLFSIVQMWLIRRATAKASAVLTPEVVDPPAATRQMRRHG